MKIGNKMSNDDARYFGAALFVMQPISCVRVATQKKTSTHTTSSSGQTYIFAQCAQIRFFLSSPFFMSVNYAHFDFIYSRVE